MFILLFLLLSQCLPCSALFCLLNREFPVENCTACPSLDTRYDGVTMTTCEKRASKKKASFICECVNFPSNSSSRPTFLYYAHVTGDVTTCTHDWAEAPHIYLAFRLLGAIFCLYAAVHVGYVIWLSGTGSCDRNKCTKMYVSSVLYCLFGVTNVFSFLVNIAGPALAMGHLRHILQTKKASSRVYKWRRAWTFS